jgi:hypothetical protein
MPKSHIRAMWDIINCRTETMGGHVYQCLDCHETQYRYHSCQNRHCPKCMNDRAEKWLEKQKSLLLPTHYHFLTFTLPEELRAIARSNQKTVYRILFKTSSESLKKLAADERHAGGMIGMTGVLHTWRRDMLYHPHVHYIVPGGGYDTENNRWRPASAKFFVPVLALSIIFRAKFRDELKKAGLTDKVPEAVWKKDWVVHSKPVGDGKHALEYIAPYVYRVAISNNRIEKFDNGLVTFRFKDSKTKQWKHRTISATEFIRRFLQHVLPRGFMKIRTFGFLSSVHRKTLTKIRTFLSAVIILLLNPLAEPNDADIEQTTGESDTPITCRHCGGKLLKCDIIPRRKRGPPNILIAELCYG